MPLLSLGRQACVDHRFHTLAQAAARAGRLLLLSVDRDRNRAAHRALARARHHPRQRHLLQRVQAAVAADARTKREVKYSRQWKRRALPNGDSGVADNAVEIPSDVAGSGVAN